MMEVHWESLAGSLVSSGFVIWLARAFIKKSLEELAEVTKQLGKIREQLAVVAVKMDRADKESDRVHQHDRQIVALEQVVYGSGWKAPSTTASRRDSRN